MRKTKTAEQENEVEAAEVGVIEGVAASFDPDPFFAQGDCRDAMLDVIRSAVDWGKFDEQRQRDVNAAIGNASRDIVIKLQRALAAEGRTSIPATIEQIVLKDGVKITAKANFDADAIFALMRTKAVEISVTDPAENMNERGPARIDADQPSLIPEGEAGDQDLVDAADPVKDVARTGDAIHIPEHGDCEIEVNLSTGMIEATPRNGDSLADRIDVREATPEELAAERERRQDDIEEPAKETAQAA